MGSSWAGGWSYHSSPGALSRSTTTWRYLRQARCRAGGHARVATALLVLTATGAPAGCVASRRPGDEVGRGRPGKLGGVLRSGGAGGGVIAGAGAPAPEAVEVDRGDQSRPAGRRRQLSEVALKLAVVLGLVGRTQVLGKPGPGLERCRNSSEGTSQRQQTRLGPCSDCGAGTAAAGATVEPLAASRAASTPGSSWGSRLASGARLGEELIGTGFQVVELAAERLQALPAQVAHLRHEPFRVSRSQIASSRPSVSHSRARSWSPAAPYSRPALL